MEWKTRPLTTLVKNPTVEEMANPVTVQPGETAHLSVGTVYNGGTSPITVDDDRPAQNDESAATPKDDGAL